MDLVINDSPSGSSSSAIVEISDLRHEFHTRAGSLPVLNGISTTFSRGTWTAVMGPSGSGKSTFLNCIAGLIRASAGRISVAGLDVTRASEKQLTLMRRDTLGFVFQSFNLVPALTVQQNISLPRLFARQKVLKSSIQAALNSVGIGEKARSLPEELSGGQQQRTAIARALLVGPAVVLADEPTGALDSRSSQKVLEEFASLVRGGSTVIMVTHDPAVASRADRTVFLVDGQVDGEIAGADPASIADRLAGWEMRGENK